MTIRVALYGRVSTSGQTVENQLADLRAVAKSRGWTIVHEYVDHGISGAKGRDRRPALDAMMKAAARRQIDVVAAWSVDRLGRSLQHLVATLADLQAASVDLYLHRQALDTSTPSGRMLYQVLGAFSEFERALITERVQAGLARARAAGRTGGRPKVASDVEGKVRALRAAGHGVRKTAQLAGVGTSVVQRIIRETRAA